MLAEEGTRQITFVETTSLIISYRQLRFFFTLLLILLGSGCARFPGKDIPVYTFADLPSGPENKICLVISEINANEDSTEIDRIISILEESGYFLKAPENCTPDEHYISNKLVLSFESEIRFGVLIVDMISHFISGYTLTLLPARGHNYYVMTIQIIQNDQVVKQYIYREHVDRWIQLFYLFKRPEPDYSRINVIREVNDRMLMNFLYDYSRDIQKGELFSEY